MRSTVVTVALVVAVVAAVAADAHGEPAPRKPTGTEAVTHYTRAARLYGNAAFADAIGEFKAAALVEPAPAIDFNLGVCYRLLGERDQDPRAKRQNYTNAIWHYERFIKTSPETPELAADVQKLIDKMRAEIDAMQPSSPSAPGETAQVPEPFYTDGIAWVVLGSGVAMLGVAGGLYWSASSLRDDADATPDQKEQNALRDRADTRSSIGTTLVVIGSGVAVVGLIKLIAHDSAPARSPPSVDVGVWQHGITVFGRF